VEKALAKWEKQVKKAEKKEQPVPEKPEVPEPAYPPEPKPGRALVADHPRFFKKVQKCRAKAVKQQGDLEVKFEKADAKMLRKVKKKVLKIARKLDDEEFAESHPLLRDSAAE